jgi:hypothetical protein
MPSRLLAPNWRGYYIEAAGSSRSAHTMRHRIDTAPRQQRRGLSS